MAADPDVPQLSSLSTYVGNIIAALIPLLGITAFVMLLVGGFTILTSSGNPESMQKGQKTITYAIGGIILAIVSWLVLLLIENITGAPVTEFKLGF